MAPRRKQGTVQTSLRLPASLYELAKSRVRDDGTARSLNHFILTAIRAYLDQLRRQEIDAAFARMAGDARYRERALALTESFKRSDWEALAISEKLRKGGHAPR